MVTDTAIIVEPTPLSLDFGVALPSGLAATLARPDWLEAALLSNSESAEQLVGRFILYHWPTRVGGWLVGKVSAICDDPAVKVGEDICNFKVFYEADQDSAFHVLSIKKYARSTKSSLDSWLLLQSV